jgi:hypothetical protein
MGLSASATRRRKAVAVLGDILSAGGVGGQDAGGQLANDPGGGRVVRRSGTEGEGPLLLSGPDIKHDARLAILRGWNLGISRIEMIDRRARLRVLANARARI